MNNETTGKQVVIGANWYIWLTVFLGTLFFLWQHLSGRKSVLAQFNYLFLDFIVFLVLLIIVSKNYILDSQALTEKLLMFPIRRIPWNNVQQIIFFHEWYDGKGIRKDSILVITLLGCEPFCKGVDNVVTYAMRHPIGSLLIYLPDRKVNECIAIFEKMNKAVIEY